MFRKDGLDRVPVARGRSRDAPAAARPVQAAARGAASAAAGRRSRQGADALAHRARHRAQRARARAGHPHAAWTGTSTSTRRCSWAGSKRAPFLREFEPDFYFDDQTRHVRVGGAARAGGPRAARRRQRRSKQRTLSAPGNPFTLADWRRTVAEQYAIARIRRRRSPRAGGAVPRARATSCSARIRRVRSSRRSARAWAGPRWFRLRSRVAGDAARSSRAPSAHTFEISLAADGVLRCTRVGRVQFTVARARGHRSRSTGSKATAAACGCRSPTRRAARARTAAGAISTTRSRAPTSASPSARSCSTSTTRTTRRARTTSAGRARCRRRRTDCRSRSRPENACKFRGCGADCRGSPCPRRLTIPGGAGSPACGIGRRFRCASPPGFACRRLTARSSSAGSSSCSSSGWSIVYTIAPKKFRADAPFQPVPWVLAIYFVFTLLRLGLAHRDRLPAWFATLSIVVDITLLLGAHLQLPHPVPAAAVVLPQVADAAVRLRPDRAARAQFRGALHLTAGLGRRVRLVADGALRGHRIDPRDSMVTRDYVTYLTSNSVLIGAEVDKIISILVFTAVLALASKRNRAPARVRGRREREQPGARPLRAERGRRASSRRPTIGVAAGQGEPRVATVLFLDIEGFTTLSENLAPQEVVRTLNEFYAAAAEPIERHNGVDQPVPGRRDHRDVQRAAAEPDARGERGRGRRRDRRRCARRGVRRRHAASRALGINTGPMVSGLIGTPDHLVYTVIGDEVNLASRLEALNKEYGTRIIVSEQTRVSAGPDRVRVRADRRGAGARAHDVDADLQGQCMNSRLRDAGAGIGVLKPLLRRPRSCAGRRCRAAPPCRRRARRR